MPSSLNSKISYIVKNKYKTGKKEKNRVVFNFKNNKYYGNNMDKFIKRVKIYIKEFI